MIINNSLQNTYKEHIMMINLSEMFDLCLKYLESPKEAKENKKS